jgi:hypothetical protein
VSQNTHASSVPCLNDHDQTWYERVFLRRLLKVTRRHDILEESSMNRLLSRSRDAEASAWCSGGMWRTYSQLQGSVDAPPCTSPACQRCVRGAKASQIFTYSSVRLMRQGAAATILEDLERHTIVKELPYPAGTVPRCGPLLQIGSLCLNLINEKPIHGL